MHILYYIYFDPIIFLFELPQKLNHVFIYVEFPILSAKMRFDYVRHQLTRALQMF